MVSLEQKGVLQLQIREREALIEEGKLEAVRDKAMVDEIVRKIEVGFKTLFPLQHRGNRSCSNYVLKV